MEKSKVFFTDFRTPAYGDGLTIKLQKLLKKAGIEQLDMDGKFVAIKMHFGELGNLSFLRPNYARAVADLVKSWGGKPFLTDCNTMYPGSRKNALEHMECAWRNGFTPLTVGCPIIIADGLKGTDDIDVPVEGGEYVKAAKIGRAVMDADIQEERRLFYVGMTRAKDKLYLYYAKERYGQELSCSRFIEELRGDGTPKPGQGEKRRQTI